METMRGEEVDRECPLSMVKLVCMYHVYSWFVYYCFSMLFFCCLPGPTIRRHRRHRTISHVPDVWYTI